MLIRHVMPASVGQSRCSVQHVSLDVEHFLSREPCLTALICAQWNEGLGSGHFQIGSLELLRAVRPGVKIPCDVACGESRLGVSNGMQCQAGIIEDPPSVLGCNLSLLG